MKNKSQYLAHNLILAAVIVCATYAAHRLMVRPSLTVPLWPATGIEVVAIFLWGRRVILGVALGELISAIVIYNIHLAFGLNTDFLFDLALLFVCIARPCLAGFWVRHMLSGNQSLLSGKDIRTFLVFGGIVPFFVTSCMFTLLLLIDGHYTVDNALTKFGSRYMGDVLSLVIVGILMMSLLAKPRNIWRPRIWFAALPTVIGFGFVFILFDSLRTNDENRILENMVLKTKYIEKMGVSQQLNESQLSQFLEENHSSLQMGEYQIEFDNVLTGKRLFSLNESSVLRFPEIHNESFFFVAHQQYRIKLTPINSFYDKEYSWSLWSIVFVSMLYTGLVGLGLLLLTGRNTLTDIEIRRRTKLLNRANKELAVSNENYRHIVDRQPVIFWKVNMLEDRIAYVSKEAESILGYPLMQWYEEGHFLTKKIHPDDLSKVKWNIQESFATGERMELEYRVLHANGEYRWFRDVINIPSEFQDSVECMGMMIDITEKKNAENKIKHLAFYDYLTNLPNRQSFQTQLAQLMTSAKKESKFGAVMFLDMDRFKVLNDALGHHFGDRLLVKIGERLKKHSEEVAVMARFGGDEFVLATKAEYDSPNDTAVNVIILAEKIIHDLAEPYQIDDHRHTCTVSMGLTVYPSDKHNVNDIIKQADAAMYRSKEQGRNQLTIYHESMKAHNDQTLYIEQMLRDAVAGEAFVLQYQPIINNNRKVVCYESLIRMSHNGEMIYPDQFIEVAEETGLIQKMGRWVIEQACQTIGKTNMPVTVNVSSDQFHQQGFIKHIESCLNLHNIEKDMLALELTEGALMGNLHEIIYKFNRLKEIGVQIAIDDFGTGYSSLEYLRKIPMNYLKIDKSFVRDLNLDKSAQVIVETIIAMAKHLNLKVVAEGVETEAQFELLKQLGCDYYQGYLFGKPSDLKLNA